MVTADEEEDEDDLTEAEKRTRALDRFKWVVMCACMRLRGSYIEHVVVWAWNRGHWCEQTGRSRQSCPHRIHLNCPLTLATHPSQHTRPFLCRAQQAKLAAQEARDMAGGDMDTNMEGEEGAGPLATLEVGAQLEGRAPSLTCMAGQLLGWPLAKVEVGVGQGAHHHCSSGSVEGWACITTPRMRRMAARGATWQGCTRHGQALPRPHHSLPHIARTQEGGAGGDLAAVRRRIKEVVSVLEDFSRRREDGRSRADYLTQVRPWQGFAVGLF